MTSKAADPKYNGQSTDDRGKSADSPGQMPKSGWKDVLVRTWKESSCDNIGIVAAGVAFYGFLAMVPLLGAIVLIYGIMADPETVVSHAQQLIASFPSGVGELIADQLVNVVQTSGGKKGLGLLLAIAVALWGARNAASSIITALNIAYDEEESRSWIRVTLLALLITAGAIALALIGGAAVAALGGLEELMPGFGVVGAVIGKIIAYAFLAAVAAGGAATIYRYAPARDQAKWTWITPGSGLFAVLWVLLTLGFGFYVSNFSNYGATYGSLSAVVVLLTWLYLSSYALLFGAELNSELEHQTAKDTTTGPERPLGTRGAWSADHLAGESAAEEPDGKAQAPNDVSAPRPPAAQEPGSGRAYLTARAANRAGHFAGLEKIGMVSSALATAGLSMLRKRKTRGAGAALLVTAAGLSLAARED